MRKLLNLVFGISLILFLLVLLWTEYISAHNVGEINFNSTLGDNPSFLPCNENKIYQYYSVQTNFIGGRKAIREFINKELTNSFTFKNDDFGYITFRFIINCKGELGRIRFKSVDHNMTKKNFSQKKVERLKEIISSLKSWNAGVIRNKKYDSYSQITFKINKGKIVDIF